MKEFHQIVKTLPGARFYYQGSHSHPVRRTILIISSNENTLCGYELREGSTLRQLKNAPIKSYKRSSIARFVNLRKPQKLKLPFDVAFKTTLKRVGIMNLLKYGM